MDLSPNVVSIDGLSSHGTPSALALLTRTVTDVELVKLLSQFGVVLAISRHHSVLCDTSSATVVMNGQVEALAIVSALSGRVLADQQLSVSLGLQPSPTVGSPVSAMHGLLKPLSRPHSTPAPSASYGLSVESTPQPGSRTNLYVCGVSADMTASALGTLFGRCGTVRHVCILATPDASDRRRAFVDMADPTGAAAAIASLNGCIAGAHSLQITYAIVQRNATTAAPSEPTLPNASIIVQGLSPSVLRTEDDVRSAFSAFGPIIDVSLHVSADAPVAGACAQITYGNAHSASSAVQACHGVGHGGFVMQVSLAEAGFLLPRQITTQPCQPELDFGDGANLNRSPTSSSPPRAPPLPPPGSFGSPPQAWPTLSPASSSSGRSAGKAPHDMLANLNALSMS